MTVKKNLFPHLAIAVLKDKEPGCFLIRDSNSFQGAYGLALKVTTLPAHASNHGETGNPQEQLVRHFLIESGAKGVKIKGCQNETYFGETKMIMPVLWMFSNALCRKQRPLLIVYSDSCLFPPRLPVCFGVSALHYSCVSSMCTTNPR